MKRKILAVVGLTLVLGIGCAIGVMAEATQIIRMDDREKEFAQMGSDGLVKASWEEEAPQVIKMWGSVLEVGESSFSFQRQFTEPEGYSEEVIVHIDPESTLILEGENGFPMGMDQLKKGETVHVYAGPAMTLSLPPQVTAQLILTGAPQSQVMPEYIIAEGSLREDGQGGFLLKAAGGAELTVPSECSIIPFLTRQMVTLSDITEGSRLLAWRKEDGTVERMVLFTAASFQ